MMKKLNELVISEGNAVASELMDASISYALGGREGLSVNEFDINNFSPRFHDVILAYLEDEIDSVTAIYIVMNRTEMKGNV